MGFILQLFLKKKKVLQMTTERQGLEQLVERVSHLKARTGVGDFERENLYWGSRKRDKLKPTYKTNTGSSRTLWK